MHNILPTFATMAASLKASCSKCNHAFLDAKAAHTHQRRSCATGSRKPCEFCGQLIPNAAIDPHRNTCAEARGALGVLAELADVAKAAQSSKAAETKQAPGASAAEAKGGCNEMQQCMKFPSETEAQLGAREGIVPPASSPVGDGEEIVLPVECDFHGNRDAVSKHADVGGEAEIVLPVSSPVGGEAEIVLPASSADGGEAGIVLPVSSADSGEAGIVPPVSSAVGGEAGIIPPASSAVGDEEGIVPPVSSPVGEGNSDENSDASSNDSDASEPVAAVAKKSTGRTRRGRQVRGGKSRGTAQSKK